MVKHDSQFYMLSTVCGDSFVNVSQDRMVKHYSQFYKLANGRSDSCVCGEMVPAVF
jgi:hypothetical protein